MGLGRLETHPLSCPSPQVKALEVELRNMSAAEKRTFRDKVRMVGVRREGA